MSVTVWLLIGYCLIALVLHVASIAALWVRCRRPSSRLGARGRGQVVSVIRPVCGLEDLEQVTLASSFHLTWPETELLFCVASAADPAVPFLQRLIAAHAGANARILIGDNCETANPKLNNLIKGWQAAKGEWIILADSNLTLPPDYVEQLLACFAPDTGLVCAPPIASAPRGFWAEVECGFLNTYQGRWQYAADALGFGFAQGKSMLWRRADLDRVGGIAALGSELAEDAAATKLVRARRALLPPAHWQALRDPRHQAPDAMGAAAAYDFSGLFPARDPDRQPAARNCRRTCKRVARRPRSDHCRGGCQRLVRARSLVGTCCGLAAQLASAVRLVGPRCLDPADLGARLYGGRL
jgi:hypothetical protein